MSSIATLSTSRPAPMTWVESLFSRMEAMYGAKFLDMWRGADMKTVKDLWADEMGKLSTDDLKRGYAALMARDWPPSLPEYVKMCKPSIDPLVAYYEAVNGTQARELGHKGEWSHPAIFWASVRVSAYDLKHCSYSQIKQRWELALSEEMGKGEWEPVPEVLQALPAPGKSELSKEHAARIVGELKAADVTKKSDDKIDHRRWAKRILEREKNGDKMLSALQVRFAREAIGAPAA